jgi:acyl carrier protein
MQTVTCDQLVEFVQSQLPGVEISMASGMGITVGWDSFAHLELIGALEDEYALTFSFTAVGEVVTMAGLLNYIQKNMNS